MNIKNLEKIYTIIGYHFLVFLNSLYGIRIGELESRKIGHFSSPVYIYICEIKLGFVKEGPRDYYFFNKIISNKFLQKNWRNHFNIWPRVILEPIYFYAIHKKNFKILTPIRSWRWNSDPGTWQSYDIHGATYGMPSFLTYTESTEESFNALMRNIKKDINWNGKIITLHVRNPCFHKKQNSSSLELDLRDANIEDFKPAIEDLLDQGYAVLRMGKGNPQFDLINHSRYLDYSLSPHRADDLDFFILNKTFLHICTGSGFDDAVAVQLKRSVLLINATEWGHNIMRPYKMMAPKKFFCKKTNQFLNLKQVINQGIDIVGDLKTLNKLNPNIEVISLTGAEIKGCINEMVENINSGKKNNEYYEKFSEITYLAYGIKKPINISSHFASCNPWFLE